MLTWLQLSKAIFKPFHLFYFFHSLQISHSLTMNQIMVNSATAMGPLDELMKEIPSPIRCISAQWRSKQVEFTCTQPFSLMHGSMAMYAVSMSGRRHPFLYQYLRKLLQ